LDLTNKPFDDILEADLQELIKNQISEKKNLEYKAELSLLSDKEKKEFLADISSFANSNGGDIYISA
jgi:predicted HTH transcriptional regulator